MPWGRLGAGPTEFVHLHQVGCGGPVVQWAGSLAEGVQPMSEAQSSPGSASASAAPPVRRDVRSWRAKLASRVAGPERAPSGLVVCSTTPGVAAVQTALMELVPEPECLTARYRISGEVSLATLVAAFAGDLCALRDGRTSLLGDLQTKTPDGWPDYLARLGTDLGWLDAGAAAPALTDAEVRNLLHRLGEPLGTRGRLSLLATTEEADLFSVGKVATWSRAIPASVILVVGAVAPDGLGRAPTANPTMRELVDRTPGSVLLEGVPADQERTEVQVRQDREANLSADQPETVDLLGREQLALTLSALLMHPDTGALCVGIEAPWGKGKSTFLNLVEKNLAEWPAGADAGTAQLTAVVRFDAWQYDTAEQAWAGLARAVIGRIEAVLGQRGRAQLRLAYAWQFRRRRLLAGVGLALAAGLIAASLVLAGGAGVADSAGKLSGVAQAVALIVGSTSVGLVVLASGLYRLMKPVSERVADYLARPNYGERLGFQHEVIRDLQFSKRWLTDHSPTSRVVVMVDDLDRCSDDKTVELLQAINVVLAGSGLYVLIGLDGDVVRRAVYRHYAGDEEKLDERHRLPADFAEDYLRKIIQFSIHLPASSAAERMRFLDGLLRPHVPQAAAAHATDSDQAQPVDLARVQPPWLVSQTLVRDTDDDVLALRAYQHQLPDNPREVKRLVNVHRFVKLAIRGVAEDLPPRTQRLLVQLLVVCTVWPERVPQLLALADGTGTPEPDLLLDAFADPSWGPWVTELRHGLPADVLMVDDLRAGTVLRQAAELAVHIP
jgi:hypothetical protein